MSEPEEQEQIARELAEELRRLRVEDVLVQSLITISAIGYRRLGATPDTQDDRDLEQTKLAIETMRALTPVLSEVVPEELHRDVAIEHDIPRQKHAPHGAASEQPLDSVTPDTRGKGSLAGLHASVSL